MMIKSKVSMDLMSPGNPPVVNGVKDDRYTRALEISLMASGTDWTVPEDAQVLISFSRPDGSGGQYDTLPNGSKAWSAEGNVLTVMLPPQVLAVSGPVSLWVSLIREEVQLSTFAIMLNVQGKAGADMEEPGSCVNVTGFLPGTAGAAAGEFLRITQVNDAGYVLAVEPVDLDSLAVLHTAQVLTEEQQEQVRKNIGAMAADAAILPAVTQEDNGKGLIVENGAWTAAKMTDEDETEEVTILPETTLDGFAYESYGYVLNVNPAPFILTAGETYTVVWDGEPWTVTAQDASSLSEGTLLLGNAEMAGLEGNGEPFLCGWASVGITLVAEAPGPHTAAIYQTVPVQKLPPVSAMDNGKIVEVVNGVWTAVNVADSSVKTFVDEYISSALEGDY